MQRQNAIVFQQNDALFLHFLGNGDPLFYRILHLPQALGCLGLFAQGNDSAGASVESFQVYLPCFQVGLHLLGVTGIVGKFQIKIRMKGV